MLPLFVDTVMNDGILKDVVSMSQYMSVEIDVWRSMKVSVGHNVGGTMVWGVSAEFGKRRRNHYGCGSKRNMPATLSTCGAWPLNAKSRNNGKCVRKLFTNKYRSVRV